MHASCKRTYANKNIPLFGKLSLMADLPLIPCPENTSVSNYTYNVDHMTEIYIFFSSLSRRWMTGVSHSNQGKHGGEKREKVKKRME